ncbi:MAG TPA: nitroreductase family deazaflavin-dependent oxidoreductase [Actinomycetota bacterium]|nr:nitroreductase family deazaflavin-dependent oxidoreductase [Actinomycetota bacterium]
MGRLLKVGDLAELDYCYVTTTGRRSGAPHTVEIWFALHEGVVYLLSGGGDVSDWVKNLREHSAVGLRLGERDMICRARLVDEPAEDELARRLLFEKYAPRYSGDLVEWSRTALPVAIDLPDEG